EGTGVTSTRSKGKVTITPLHAAFGKTFTIHRDAKSVRIMLLTQHEAENAWRATIDGQPYLVETDQEYFAGPGEITLRSDGIPHAAFAIYPALNCPLTATYGSLESRDLPGVSAWHIRVPAQNRTLKLVQVRQAGPVPPVQVSAPLSWQPQGVAMAPPDSAFDRAAAWRLTIPKDFLSGVSDVFLDVRYTGDVARLRSRDRLLDDDFYNGEPWRVGLRRFAKQISEGPLDLSILPLRKDAPIYLERPFRPEFDGKKQIVDVKKLVLVPQYQFVIRTELE
ncbi:MAG TPA: hypothetical protein VHE09_00350, partial [Rhizomicrobium sp.]|nr:hypothetical protein [Rhizomicrobium sp.]